MRRLGQIALLLAVVLMGAALGSGAARARTATIEVAAQVQDRTEEGVRSALMAAVQSAAKGALAMGLEWMQVSHATMIGDAVAVQVVATDTPPDDSAGATPPNQDENQRPDQQAPEAGDLLKADTGQAPAQL